MAICLSIFCACPSCISFSATVLRAPPNGPGRLALRRRAAACVACLNTTACLTPQLTIELKYLHPVSCQQSSEEAWEERKQAACASLSLRAAMMMMWAPPELLLGETPACGEPPEVCLPPHCAGLRGNQTEGLVWPLRCHLLTPARVPLYPPVGPGLVAVRRTYVLPPAEQNARARQRARVCSRPAQLSNPGAACL